MSALSKEDDNTWWRAGSGHGLNAYDAAREVIDDLSARLATADRLAALLDSVHRVCSDVVMDTGEERDLHDIHVQQMRDITAAIRAACTAALPATPTEES